MSDAPLKFRKFVFVGHEYLPDAGKLSLRYRYDEGVEMVEEIVFPDAPPDAESSRGEALRRACASLHLIAGISYYKAALPEVIETPPLSTATAVFLNQLYREGLGEFAHVNRLELSAQLFASSENPTSAAVTLQLPHRALLPVGGGKDSLVSVELLRSAGTAFTLVAVGSASLIEEVMVATGLPRLLIGRRLSPELAVLNREGAYNGHVPVTAINSAILVCAALIYGYDQIIFSNEHSASSGNLVSRTGEEINHQYSKSLAFEQLYAQHVATEISPDLTYFSLLRPWCEMEIVRRFVDCVEYHTVFSSCNRNFHLEGSQTAGRWCGDCPKCRFVFLALAAFMEREAVVGVFGFDLLDDARQVEGYDALIGYRHHKPFECVGEIEESRAALAALGQNVQWRDALVVKRFATKVAAELGEIAPLDRLCAERYAHRVPGEYRALIR